MDPPEMFCIDNSIDLSTLLDGRRGRDYPVGDL